MPVLLKNWPPSSWLPVPGDTLIGTDGSGVWVKDENGTTYYLVGGSVDNQYTASTNNSGNTTLSRTASTHVAVLNVGGSARTSVVILDTADGVSGDVIKLRINMPATASIVIEVRNATSGGTLLYTYTSDGSGDDGYFEVYFDGSEWQRLLNILPAY